MVCKVWENGIEMNLETYKRYIDLTHKQNYCERDIYSYVIQLFRECVLDEPISVLDISGRKNSNRGKIFYGISSVPDIGIVQESFNNHSNDDGNVDNLHEILGCIEIKNIDSDIKKSKLINSLQSVLEKIKNNTYKKADNSYFIDEQEYIGFT